MFITVVVIFCVAIFIAAYVYCPIHVRLLSAKYRVGFVAVAVGAYMVKRLAILMIWLECIKKNSSAYFIKKVAAFLFVPVCLVYNFFFEFTFRIQKLMIISLQRENDALKRKDRIV